MFSKRVRWFKASSLYLFVFILVFPCLAQESEAVKDQYFMTDEQRLKLQIVVHIWGEVNRPGQYIVPDGTNVLELISLAGGPSEYSSLGNIKLTREYLLPEAEDSGSGELEHPEMREPLKEKVIYKIDLNKHLNKKELEHIHVLKPGDVVKVGRNSWYKFQAIIRVLSQIAILAQGLYFYSLIFGNTE